MPKEHFSVERAVSLSAISKGSKIHVIGVSGVAMAQLAVALSEQGYIVSGSDKEFYEPMGSFLRASTVKILQGYSKEHIGSDLALVVIGNAVGYQNEEVLEVEKKKLPYSLFPKMLHDLVISGKHSVVVSGTHGKSTTSALLAWLFTRLNLDPSYFVGAVVPDLARSLHCGSGPYCVVEGDEYDSAFFAKVPKFKFYKPDTLIITSIEYDHADIYPSLQAIVDQFTDLVLSMPQDSKLLCCLDSEVIAGVIDDWRSKAACAIYTYGTTEEADLQLVNREVRGRKQEIDLALRGAGEHAFAISMPGEHNALNATAAYMSCLYNDLDVQAVSKVIEGFVGAQRRQEIRVDTEKVLLIDDFAHHPTAVRETVRAIKMAYPGRRLIAVFEPRSNTSRRKVFQNDYIEALREANRVVLCDVVARESDKGQELISVASLAEGIGLKGVPALVLPDADAICSYILGHVENGDVVLVMSNGGFGGLVAKLEKGLR